jgi:hypothetical protein
VFEMLAASLRYPDRTVDHEVPLVGGRPPAEFDRPTGDGRYERFRLLEWNGEIPVYAFTGVVPESDGGPS